MQTVTARQCAAHWGISESRARRILAPLTPAGRDTETGAMLYDQEQAEAAHRNRPGRGTRNDRTVTPLTDAQFEQLVTDDSIPASHRALWALLRDGHARVGDVLALRVSDVDLDERTARIEAPKREADPRAVPISERTVSLLHEVMVDRESGPLITGTHGRALGRESAARFARLAGASIHAFRPRPHDAIAKRHDDA